MTASTELRAYTFAWIATRPPSLKVDVFEHQIRLRPALPCSVSQCAHVTSVQDATRISHVPSRAHQQSLSLSLSQKPSSPHQRRTVPPTRELGKREGGGHAQIGRHRPSSLSLSRLSRRPSRACHHESAQRAWKTRERHTRLPSSSARPKSSLSVCCLPNRSRSIPNSKKKNQEESLAARCRTLRQTSLKRVRDHGGDGGGGGG